MLRVIACFALIVVSVVSVPAPAQNRATTAEITGRIEDATGGVLPGSAVTVANLENGLIRTAVSDS